MKLVAISDIHIENTSDPIYEPVRDLVKREVDGRTCLVFAGDIFDFWVGDQRSLSRRYGEFLELLREKARAGAEIHYIEGNHDFHLKKAFRSISNIRVHAREISIDLGGKKLYVAHGDLVDRGDVGYLALRAFFRSPVIRLAARALPDRAVEAIGDTSARASRKVNPRVAEEGSERLERTRRLFRNFAVEKIKQGYDYVILGHCHDSDEIKFRLGDREGQYLNVGYPKAHRKFIRWAPGDSFMEKVSF